MTVFSGIQAISAHEAIVNHFRKLIAEGQVRSGEKLPSERELAATLGVGRPALREALRELVSLGLIKRDSKGTFVNDSFENGVADRILSAIILRQSDADQLYQARKIIEVGAIPFVVNKLDAHALGQLKQCIDKMRMSLGNKTDYIKADVGFHLTLIEAMGNRLLLDIMTILCDLLHLQQKREHGELYRRIPDKAPLILARYDLLAIEEHVGILCALVERDNTRASSLLLAHIENAEKMSRFEELDEG